ncbi:unnamed protein product [Closterium sp. NIES-65]|nr:unnamed protein product [Closterium sp. NIES-65]
MTRRGPCTFETSQKAAASGEQHAVVGVRGRLKRLQRVASSLRAVLLQLLSGRISVPALLPIPAPPSSHPSLLPLLPTHPCSASSPAPTSLGVVLLQLLSGRISDASGKTMPEFFREAVSIEGERI